MTPKSFLVAYKGPSTYQLTLGEGSMKSAIALSFITKFMTKIMPSGGGRVKKWLKIASIDMWMVPKTKNMWLSLSVLNFDITFQSP